MTEVACSSMGSSPHTRGALGEDNARDDPARIIPAYAGSTGDQWGQDRVRVGSSPHTRGARRGPGRRSPGPGIIPAYAGSTPPTKSAPSKPSDHPRIRGEHLERLLNAVRFVGSSPHTRGARLPLGTPAWAAGIIPAYAGSTAQRIAVDGAPPDHPRIRGEHHVHAQRVTGGGGSSPHTRGALDDLVGLVCELGIIPAYAGSTGIGEICTKLGLDHPRIRGEHAAPHDGILAVDGSSPHTRGAPRSPCSKTRCWRIIPAYAGSTVSVERAVIKSADHPRIRGEHWSRREVFSRAKGSSPHTRGALIRAKAYDPNRSDHPRIRGEHVGGQIVLLAIIGSSPHTRGAPRDSR